MCALVLALRKIPIYAPGGGDATLGSSDKPTYSVTVTDAEAAANRDAFAKTKAGKRLVPPKQPDEPQPIESLEKRTTATDLSDSAMPSPLRYRLPTLNESTALKELNTRPPAADTAHHRADSTDSDLNASGSTTPHDTRRSADLEEVRGLLGRHSTRGKRKTQTSANMITGTLPPSIPPLQDFGLTTPRMEVEYNSYPPQTLDPYLPQNVTGYPARPVSPAMGFSGTEMQQVSTVRRPVPGSGNAFAQEAREDRERQQREREEAVRKERERETQ